jgi:lysophospholipase L1-like esterase
VDDYLGEFHRLLRRAITLAGDRAGRVLVLSIPDWGATPFAFASGRDRAAIAADLDAYNAAAQALCAAHGVAFVDITGISRDRGDAPEMLADDALHPSARQYTRWTAAALPVALAAMHDRGRGDAT